MAKPLHPHPERKHRRTSTLWLWDDWAGLNGPQLKLKLLEKTANSEEGQERFWRKVRVNSSEKCWEWISSFTMRGYGLFGCQLEPTKRVSLYAHRISYRLAYGKFPPNLEVCHTCDNPKCVNPDHLFLGDQIDNVADMVKKERNHRGESTGTSKLITNQVQQMRILHIQEKVPCIQIAKLFRMSLQQTSDICHGKAWKHLPLPTAR